MKILMITSEWPSPQMPYAVPFISRQVDYLRRAGIDVDVFHFRGGKNPIKYLRAWYRVHLHLACEQYDLVHAQWGQSVFPILPKQIPLVVTFRGSDVEGIVDSSGNYVWYGKLLSSFSRIIALLADQAIVVSEKLVSKLPEREYHIIPSGLDIGLFHPMNQVEARSFLNLPLDSEIILFGGDPKRAEKRFPLAQAAVELIRDDFPRLQIIVPQNIEHSLMPFYLNAADVMLMTSLYEGSPNMVKEALACNLPVVSTDVGDVRKRIGELEGCIVCYEDDPNTIAQGIKKVLLSRTRIKGFQVVEILDEHILVQQIIQVYKKALEK